MATGGGLTTVSVAGAPLDRGPSLTDRVVLAVRDGIRDRRFVPGEIYSVYQLADLLGVSRSPVREALVRLAEAGLVVFSRNRGFEVVLPRARDVAEIFTVRLALEPLGARRAAAEASDDDLARLAGLLRSQEQAADRMDPEAFWPSDLAMHDLLLRIGLGSRAASVVDGLRATTALLGPATSVPGRGTAAAPGGPVRDEVVEPARSLREIAAEHVPVVNAVTARDAAGAEATMRAHLVHTGRLLVARVAGLSVTDPKVSALWASP